MDSEELVEGIPGHEPHGDGRVSTPASSEFAKVLVRHHGAEEVVTFDMGSRWWGYTELGKWMQRHLWFNPLADER